MHAMHFNMLLQIYELSGILLNVLSCRLELKWR